MVGVIRVALIVRIYGLQPVVAVRIRIEPLGPDLELSGLINRLPDGFFHERVGHEPHFLLGVRKFARLGDDRKRLGEIIDVVDVVDVLGLFALELFRRRRSISSYSSRICTS